MVIKIHQTISTEKAFYYNEKKVEEGEAVFFQSANTLSSNPFVYSKTRRLKEFLDIEKQNQRIKNKCLHISVNPSQGDIAKLNDKMIRKEIQNFMDHLGYGNQPYYVYKHKDLERIHFHIVSTRVDRENGNKVKDNNERRKVQTFIKDLELKYQLDKKSNQEKLTFKFSPKSRNIKQSLENLFYHLNHTEQINSKERYEQALKLFNVEIQKSGRGHIVVVTNDDGKPIRYPIRLSKFKEQPMFHFSEKINSKIKEDNKKTERVKWGLTDEFLRALLKQYSITEQERRKRKSARLPKRYKKRRIR